MVAFAPPSPDHGDLRMLTGHGFGQFHPGPGQLRIRVTAAGIGLPDRDYYLSNDEAIVKTRAAYRKYLGNR